MTIYERVEYLRKRFPRFTVTIHSVRNRTARISFSSPSCRIRARIHADGRAVFEYVLIERPDCAEQLLDIIHALDA